MSINNTQRREALKIVIGQAKQAQKVAIAKLRESIKGEQKAPAPIQKKYQAMMVAEVDYEAARKVHAEKSRQFRDAVGDVRGYGNRNYVVNDGVVSYRTPHYDRIQQNTDPFSYGGRTHKESDPVQQALRLKGVPAAAATVDVVEALEEFITVEAPAEVWLSDTVDATKFLASLTARIAGIIG